MIYYSKRGSEGPDQILISYTFIAENVVQGETVIGGGAHALTIDGIVGHDRVTESDELLHLGDEIRVLCDLFFFRVTKALNSKSIPQSNQISQ